jgi:hypothetical protein
MAYVRTVVNQETYGQYEKDRTIAGGGFRAAETRRRRYALFVWRTTVIEEAKVAEPMDEPTASMIEAGVLAAELEGFEYGWGEEEALVRRVYLAMQKAALSPEAANE